MSRLRRVGVPPPVPVELVGISVELLGVQPPVRVELVLSS